MLVRANSFHSKPISRDVVTTFQGSSNFDHLKKAAENLMRQQHSDKTDFELANQRTRTLEYEKSELVETNTKLLETKVKLETIAQSAKKNYDALRFDCIAVDTVCKSVQEHVADAQKKSSTINNEISLLKDRMKQLQSLCESSEAILSKEIISSRELKTQITTLKHERDSAARQRDEFRTQIQALTSSLNTSIADKERLQKMTEEQSIQIQQIKEQGDRTKQDSMATQDDLQKQIVTKVRAMEQMSEEFQIKLRLAEESESKVRLEFEQSLRERTETVAELKSLLSVSEEKCKEWESIVDTSSEKSKELEQEKLAIESQHTQTIEALRNDQLKLEQERESLKKEMADLREEFASAVASRNEVVDTLQKVTIDLEEARGSLADARKDNEHRQVLEASAVEKTKELSTVYEARESELKEEVANVNKRIAEMQAEKEAALKSQLAGFNAMKEALVAGAQKTENDLVAQLSEVLEKERSLSREKKDLVQDIATLAAKLNEAQKDLEDAQKESKEVNNKGNKADKKQIEKLNQLVDQQKKEIQDLKQKLTKQPPAKSSTPSSSNTSTPTPSSSFKSSTPTSSSHKSSTPTSASAKFLIHAKDVPTSEDRDTTESTDSAPTPSSSKKDAVSEPKKKRQLRSSTPEYASPTKKVHFLPSQPTKKIATYSKRKTNAKPKSSEFEDEYTFRG